METSNSEFISPIQQAIARIFFALPESAGFYLAGGAALIAQGGIERDTDDLDAFTADARTIRAAGEALSAACRQQGFDVEVMDSFDTFVRILVSRGDQ